MAEKRKSKGGRRSEFSDAFKRQVALDYLEGDYSLSEVAQKYDQLTKGMVYHFVQWFKRSGRDDPEAFVPALSEQDQKDNEALKRRNEELEQLLEKERLRALAFETMIEIAERELGIAIRKKSDTKQ